MRKRRVQLAQVNHRYGRNVFLPYSVGTIQAYCRSIPRIDEHFDFAPPLFLREPPATLAASLRDVSVIGLSCYIWNWRHSLALAAAVKQHAPECLVVLGGPHVPDRSDGFFVEHPFVDVLVHQEGELPFADILLASLEPTPRYEAIAGLSVRGRDGRTVRTGPRDRVTDLAALPSPYLSGVFDGLLDAPYDFQASQETHRGCPYKCTFCDWGSAVFTKVRRFPNRRIEQEIDWFGQKGIDLLYNCDANFGLFPDDVALAERLAEAKARHGGPRKFRAAYAKRSNQRVFSIAKVLNDAGMCKGITLSFQSLHDETLDLVKRSNIKMDDFESLMSEYRREGIPTYTEMILGLPGETYDSLAEGLDRLLRAGAHESLNVYPCILLPNSELAHPEQRRAHDIRTVEVPILHAHGAPSDDDITEYYEIVIATRAMPHEEWRRAYLLAWAMQAFHSMGLLRLVAIYLHHEHGLAYRRFYEALLAFADAHPDTRVGREKAMIDRLLDRVCSGGPWDLVLPAFGDVIWPSEEASCLNVMADVDRFYAEAHGFLRGLDLPAMDAVVLRDVLAYQAAVVVRPDGAAEVEVGLAHDLVDYFAEWAEGRAPSLRSEPVHLRVTAERTFGGDLETFAREVVWYGRKGGRFLHRCIEKRAPA